MISMVVPNVIGSVKSASMIDCCVDPSFGSLRHSSMQGFPPSVAMTPDIEQKLLRMRASTCSPETSGIMNKVKILG